MVLEKTLVSHHSPSGEIMSVIRHGIDIVVEVGKFRKTRGPDAFLGCHSAACQSHAHKADGSVIVTVLGNKY